MEYVIGRGQSDMALVSRRKVREARSVRVVYENPLTVARRGNLTAGTVRLIADNVLVTLHTVYGAAKRLRRSAVRVQQLIEDKQLRAHKFGRDWLILDADLKNFPDRSQRAESIGRTAKVQRGRTLVRQA